jgi:hypothetical protein
MAFWTGLTNWTEDSWTLQENVILTARSRALAAAYSGNFEELWRERDVEKTGRSEPTALRVEGQDARAWFTPGHGPELSHRIAQAIGRARTRVRIASPVITAGSVPGTLVEVAAEGRVDLAGVVDRPQMEQVFEQWQANSRSAWKLPSGVGGTRCGGFGTLEREGERLLEKLTHPGEELGAVGTVEDPVIAHERERHLVARHDPASLVDCGPLLQ